LACKVEEGAAIGFLAAVARAAAVFAAAGLLLAVGVALRPLGLVFTSISWWTRCDIAAVNQ
jgi:hypothetical protein